MQVKALSVEESSRVEDVGIGIRTTHEYHRRHSAIFPTGKCTDGVATYGRQEPSCRCTRLTDVLSMRVQRLPRVHRSTELPLMTPHDEPGMVFDAIPNTVRGQTLYIPVARDRDDVAIKAWPEEARETEHDARAAAERLFEEHGFSR
jgi:hypothetical protein